MLSWLDEILWGYVALACLTLGLAPFVPEPHVLEKLRMLFEGTLSRPLDIFDLFMHGSPYIVGILKAVRTLMPKSAEQPEVTPQPKTSRKKRGKR